MPGVSKKMEAFKSLDLKARFVRPNKPAYSCFNYWATRRFEIRLLFWDSVSVYTPAVNFLLLNGTE